MSGKAIVFILGIARSQFTKRIAPHILDENLIRSMKTSIKKISEGIDSLLLKDLNTAQDMLEESFIQLNTKFGEEQSNQKKSTKNLRGEIEKDLKTVKNHAISGLKSGLGSAEQVACLKIILITECLLLLNTLTSVDEIKKDEKKDFENKLKIAKGLCYKRLQELNAIKEVSEYLSRELSPNTMQIRITRPSASSIGKGEDINKEDLARDVIAINFYVRLFLHQWDEKLYAENSGKKKGFPKLVKPKKLIIMGVDGVRGRSSEKKAQMLAGYDFLFVGAAFSVIKHDEDLAEIIEEYILTLGEVEQQICMNLLKRDLPTNKGVQKAFDKQRSGSDTITRWAKSLGSLNEDAGDEPDMTPDVKTKGFINVLNRLSRPSVSDYLETSCCTDRETSAVEGAGVSFVPSAISELFHHNSKDKAAK